MNETLQRAVLAVVASIRRGIRVTLGRLSFWRPFGPPSIPERRQAIAAAQSILQASSVVESGTMAGTVGELFAGQGEQPTGDTGGIMGRPTATVHVVFQFDQDSGGTAFRGWSVPVAWDTTLDQLDIRMAEAISDFEDQYELSSGTIVPGSMLIY